MCLWHILLIFLYHIFLEGSKIALFLFWRAVILQRRPWAVRGWEALECVNISFLRRLPLGRESCWGVKRVRGHISVHWRAAIILICLVSRLDPFTSVLISFYWIEPKILWRSNINALNYFIVLIVFVITSTFKLKALSIFRVKHLLGLLTFIELTLNIFCIQLVPVMTLDLIGSLYIFWEDTTSQDLVVVINVLCFRSLIAVLSNALLWLSLLLPILENDAFSNIWFSQRLSVNTLLILQFLNLLFLKLVIYVGAVRLPYEYFALTLSLTLLICVIKGV